MVGPGARRGVADRVHRGGGGVRLYRGTGPLGLAAGLRARPGMGARSGLHRQGRRQCLGAPVRRRRDRTRCRGRTPDLGPAALAARAGTDRERAAGGPPVHPTPADQPVHAGRAHLARRFRHRLFVAVVPAQPADPQYQDRPLVHQRRAGRGGLRGADQDHHRHGAGAQHDRHGRGRGNPEQTAFLEAHACDEVQGFLFGRPLEVPAMEGLLRSQGAVSI